MRLMTGQVGAIRLGISKALQNWEPDLRPALKDGTISQQISILSCASKFHNLLVTAAL